MKLQLKTAVTINATPEKVWEILMNFEEYQQWNPFIKSLTGNVKEGEQLNAHIQDMRFKPTVIKVEPNQEFRWLGKLFFKGVFDGEHYFLLQPNEAGGTEFVHGENFSGILVGMFKNKLKDKTQKGFMAMNEALKKEAEKH